VTPVQLQTKGWHASLDLAFVASDWGTIASKRSHEGPLRLQKVLYPEGNSVAHAIVLHPPGGAAGADSLTINLSIGVGAHVVATTPSAAKWYGCDANKPSSQVITLEVAAGGILEWLPQESIVFDQAHSSWRTRVLLAPQAKAVGMEVIMLGRQASDERFCQGAVSTQLEIIQNDHLLYTESSVLKGSDPRFEAMQGLHGQRCFGQLWVAAKQTDLQLAIETLQAQSDTVNGVRCASTLVRAGLLIVRAVGGGPEVVRGALELAWHRIRRQITGRQAQPLRIWST
jgi:urease accessory protein